MNRLVRALVGVVVAKAAVASAWYLYQKSTEQENDWKTEGQEDKQNQIKEEKNEVEPVEPSTPVKVKAKKPVRKNQEAKPVVDSEQVKPKRVRTPATKKVDTTNVSKEETVKPKRVRKPVAKNAEQTPTVDAKKSTRSRSKKA